MRTKRRILSFILAFTLMVTSITVTPIIGKATTVINQDDITYQILYPVGVSYASLRGRLIAQADGLTNTQKTNAECITEGNVTGGWNKVSWYLGDNTYITLDIYGDDNISTYGYPDDRYACYDLTNKGILSINAAAFSGTGTISLDPAAVPWHKDDTIMERIQTVQFSGFDRSTRYVSLNGLFEGCTSLYKVGTLPKKTQTLDSAFKNCSLLYILPSFTSLTDLTTLNNAFNGCTNLTSTPDVSNCTKLVTLESAFAGTKISTPPDTSKMTTLYNTNYAFKNCTKLKTGLDLSKDNSLLESKGTYQNCTALTSCPDITNKKNLTTIQDMFKGCTSMTSLPSFKGCSGLQNISGLYSRWTQLTKGPTLDLKLDSYSELTDVSNLFYGCSNMTSVPDISVLENATKITNVQNMFYGCSSLSGILKFTVPKSIRSSSVFSGVAANSSSRLVVDYTCADDTMKQIITASKNDKVEIGKNINTYTEIKVLPSIHYPPFGQYGAKISEATANGQSSSKAVNYFGEEVEGTFSFSPDITLTCEDQTTTVTFTPSDSKYASATKEATYRAKDINIDDQFDTDPSVKSSYPYGTALKDIEITPGTFKTTNSWCRGNIPGEWKFKNENTVLDVGTSEQTIYFVPSTPNFKSEKTFKVNVTITKKQLSEDMLTFDASDKAYTGSEICPTVTMKHGSNTMNYGTDYTTEFTNNVKTGTATMVVTGTGRYYGTIVKTYKIVEADISSQITIENKTYEYDTKNHTLNVNIPDGAAVMFGTSEGTYDLTTIPRYINAGTYRIYWKVTKDQYKTVTGSSVLTIKKKTVTSIQFPTATKITYGNPLSTSTLYGGSTDGLGSFRWKDGTIKPTATNQGYDVVFTASDMDNYDYSQIEGFDTNTKTLTKTVAINVTKANCSVPSVTATGLLQGSALSESTITADDSLGTFEWNNPSQKAVATVSQYNVRFTPNDIDNYKWNDLDGWQEEGYLLIPCNVTVVNQPTLSSITYGDPLSYVLVTNTGTSISGSFHWDNPETVLNAGTHRVNLTYVPNTSNFQTFTFPVDVVVEKATPNILTYPTAGTITYGNLLSASALLGGVSNIPGRFAWENEDEVLNAGTYSRRVIFVPEDTDNYERIGMNISVTVNKATPKINKVPEAGSSYPYGKKLNEIPFVGGEANVEGTFAWQNDSVVPEIGTKTYTVTFTPDVTMNYNKTTTQVSVTIDKSAPTVTTKPTVTGTLTYGQALSELTLSGGTAKNENSTSYPTVEGTFSWANGTSVLSAGTHDVKVIFTPTDTSHYTTTETTVTVTVKKATPVISVNPVCTTISYGQKVSQSTLSGGTASVFGSFAWQDGSEILNAGVHSKTVVFTPTDTNNYNTTTCSISLVIDKVTPKVTSAPTTKESTYGKTLRAISLNGGTASVDGTFVWNTPNEIPNVGTTSYSVTFTPTDNTNYLPVVIQVPVTIKKATPTISQMPTFGNLTYGNTLNSLALTDGTASVDGAFQWKNGTKVPETGTSEETIIFTPTDTSHYETVEKTVSVKTVKNTPIILTFPQAAPIIYGSKVSESTLSGGRANVEGTFEWQNGNEMLDAGSYAKTVVFTPTDTKNYEVITKDITLLVNQATPVIVAPTAPTKAYGVRLNEIPLEDGSSNVAGVFSWNTTDTIPDVGTTDYEAVFTPTDTKNYKSVTCSVSVNIKKATPVITKTPSFEDLVYGKSLGTLSLTNGTASVEGTFSWEDTTKSPETGSSEEVILFTPNDTDHYEIVRKTVTVKTIKNTPTIVSLPQASEITYGDTVSQSTLSGGSASTEGEFAWKNGTDVLDAGTYTREITFTPNDTKNYETITANVSLKVNQATPVISEKPTTETKPYGVRLHTMLLKNGSANVNGEFSWRSTDTVPEVGTTNYEVIFTPEDTKNYKTITCNIPVTIVKATPEITTKPSYTDLVYGQALESLTLTNGIASVAGAFQWKDGKKKLPAGTSNETVRFVPSDTGRYEVVEYETSVVTRKAAPVVSVVPTVTSITYGECVSSSAIQGGETSVEGSFAWEDGSEMLSAGTHTKAVVFTPNDTDNYETQKVNVSLTVKKATPVITKIPTAEAVSYGTSLENIALENGASSIEGTFDWKNDTTVPEVGISSQMAVFTPTDSDNYNSVELKVSVTVKKLVPTISKKPSYGELTYGNTLQSLTLSSGVASTNGSFQWKEASQKPEAGTSTEVVEFIPTDLAHYEMVEYETEVTTLKADPVISVLPESAAITYGECISGSAIQGGETSVEGTFAWENNEEMLSAGSYNKTAIFTPNDTKNYNSKKVKISITVNKATPDITKIPTTETKAYGVSLQDIALQGGISNVEGQFRWKEISTVPDVETRSYKAVFTPTDTDNYNVVEIDVPVTIVKATPIISNVPTFGNLIYGNTLGSLTLTGGYASVFGSFAWKYPDKTTTTGISNEIIAFTPNDAKHYESVEFEVSVNTVKATPEIQTMPTASNITYGDVVASSVISGGAISTEGTFSWENEEDILDAGTYTRTAIFTPKDTKNYKTITTPLSLVVEKKAPDITTYPEVGETTYGKALNQLNMSEGVASVAGTFRWKNGTTIPETGKSQFVMEFVPDDTNNYKTISFDIPVVVTKATPIVNAYPVSSKITYTQQLGESQLTGGTASVPGEFCWVSGEIQPKAGTRNYEVAFIPTDEKNYNQVTFSVLVTIDPAATSITSTPTATDIVYGQKMQESSLFGGVGSVPGRFEWLDGDDVLNAGSYLRTVCFIPEDDKNYKESYCNVAFIIKKATPTIETTPVPSVITYGEALSTSRLTNGEADVEGEFTWRDGSTCPPVGESSQTVIFTPTDSDNYNRAIFDVVVTTKPKDVSELDISCDLSDKTYTGTAITPEVIVKDGLKVCKQNTDYEIVYQNNTKIGTADIDIVGIGNYTGSVKKQFQIIAKDMSDKVIVPDITTTYNGEKHYIQPNIPSGAVITFGMSSALYNTKETPYFTNAGDYTVYWKVEQEHYKTVYGETHVIINPKKITDVVFPNATDITYGNTLGTSTLSNGSLTGKFTWKDPDLKPIVKNDGYEVVFTANDTGNYDYSSISDFNDEKHTIIRKVSLKVNPAEGKVPVFSVTGIMEGEELSLSTIYSTDTILGTFSWNTPEMKISLSNTAQDIMFIPNDTVNYNWSNINGWDEKNKYAKFKYTVPVIAKPTATTIVEGQTLANSKLTSSQELTTYSWEDESIVPKAGTHSYKVNCVLGNTTVTRDIPVTVLKNDLKVSVPDTTFDYDGTSHSLTVTADDGVTIMYGTEDGKYPYAECPSYQEVGSYKIFWKAEKDGYTSVTGVSTLTIEAAKDAETTDQTAQSTVVLGKTPLKIKLVNKKQYVTLSYARNTLASGYEIQYSLKKNFKKSYKLSVASNKIKVTKKTATRKKTQGPIHVSKAKNAQITTSIGMKYLTKKLKAGKGKSMYVRVRCYRTEKGKKIYNNWSKVMKAKTF